MDEGVTLDVGVSETEAVGVAVTDEVGVKVNEDDIVMLAVGDTEGVGETDGVVV